MNRRDFLQILFGTGLYAGSWAAFGATVSLTGRSPARRITTEEGVYVQRKEINGFEITINDGERIEVITSQLEPAELSSIVGYKIFRRGLYENHSQTASFVEKDGKRSWGEMDGSKLAEAVEKFNSFYRMF